jgi:phosphoribosylformylglycinamidine (FGAM) synthase-like amidotransferase family enzyme
MPHPERATELILGSDDGRRLLKGFVAATNASPQTNSVVAS